MNGRQATLCAAFVVLGVMASVRAHELAGSEGVAWASARPKDVQQPPAALLQPTAPFPTLPPTRPFPTLPSDVPTPSIYTPTPTPTPSATRRASPTASASPTATITPTPTATRILDLDKHVFAPYCSQFHELRTATPTATPGDT